MASPTQWTWVCTNSRRQWRTGNPGMLLSMGVQRWTQLSNWTTNPHISYKLERNLDTSIAILSISIAILGILRMVLCLTYCSPLGALLSDFSLLMMLFHALAKVVTDRSLQGFFKWVSYVCRLVSFIVYMLPWPTEAFKLVISWFICLSSHSCPDFGWLLASLVVQETKVWSLGWEDPLEEEMATYSSVLALRIPRTEEPGGLESVPSHRVRHNWVTEHIHTVFSVVLLGLLSSLSTDLKVKHRQPFICKYAFN